MLNIISNIMPTNFTQAQRTALLNILQTGKRNAINAERLSLALGFPAGGNQVQTRNLIRECIEVDGDLIGSSLSNPKGFYLIDQTNIRELESYLDSLENRSIDILQRRTWLIRNWNNTVPGNPTTKIAKYVNP